MIRIALILSTLAYTGPLGATQPSPTLPCETRLEASSKELEACDKAVEAARVLISAQDLSIKHLQDNQKLLMDEVADSKAREASLPTWMTILVGIVIGATAVSLAK